MAKVRLLHGKPLLVGGKVAISDDCCCGGAPFHCNDVETITVVFAGIANCDPPGIPESFNGTFVLMQTFPGSKIWEGIGNDYTIPFIPGTFHTIITVACEESPNDSSVDYRDDSSGPAFFSYITPGIPPSWIGLPNSLNCTLDVTSGGTATVSLP